MPERASAEIIVFPTRLAAPPMPSSPPDTARERLLLTLGSLEEALAVQRAAVAQWRGSLGELRGAVGNLGGSLTTYRDRLASLGDRLASLNTEARRLEQLADTLVATPPR